MFQECLIEVVLSFDGGHVKRGEPLEGRAGHTFLEQAHQQPLISLELSEISTVHLQMGNRVASTIIFVKVQDTEFQWEHRLWEVAEVPELVALVVSVLH